MTRNLTPFRAHATPVVAVSPDDPAVLAIAEGEARSGRCSLHVSTNAGLSWHEATSPQPPEWPICVRNTQGPIADLAFDSSGTIYYAFVGWKPDDWHSRIFLARSADAGRSWETTELPGLAPPYGPADSGSNALPSVVLDPTRPRRVYVTWSRNYGLWNLEPLLPDGKKQADYPRRPVLAVSDDGGRTFSHPVDIGGDVKASLTVPQMVVGKDGELFAFFGEFQGPPDAKDARLYLATSRDGGRTWAQKAIHTMAKGAMFAFLLTPVPGVNRGTGELFVVWEDTGRRPPAVLFMRSSDRGTTWSEPVKLNDVDPQRNWDFKEFNPSIDVAPNGRIDAVWTDWRDDITFVPEPNRRNALQHVYYTYSTDGGRTWAPNVRVTDRAIDRRLSIWSTGVNGPVGLASRDGVAYAAWDDSRNSTVESQTQDVYFTRVRLSPEGILSVSSGPTAADKLTWALLGVSIALIAGGGAMVAVWRFAPRRRTQAA
ncbi:MAG: glycoside hydrolase [Actinomycetota bacterium]|nr:glycoside hydrolase [Actinomycetota bacterium]